MKENIPIYSDILTSIKTVQDVENLYSEIDLLTLTLFESENTSLDQAITLIRTSTAKMVKEIFLKNNLNIADKEGISDFLENLKAEIVKLKVIKLILAFEPTPKTIGNIHDFVKDTIGIGYILDIEVSASILGGSVVMFNGKYNDFTLRKKLRETFELKKKEIYEGF